MRTVLRFTLVCSRCNSELACNPDDKVTKMNFQSSSQAEAVMAIEPCQYCISLARRPVKMIKEALVLAAGMRD